MFSLNTLFKLYKIEKLTPEKKWLAKSLTFFKANIKKEKADGILLVQMVTSYDYTIKLAAASKVLAEKNNLFVNLCVANIKFNWKEKKLYSFLNALGLISLEKVYLSFGNKVVFNNSDKHKDQAFIKKRLNEIIDELDNENIEGLLALKFDDIVVGDLIYDTYLRFFHQPTITKIDENVIYTIELALNLFYNFNNFIKTNNVKVLLHTYTAYIQHGIPARVCLHNNIEVYTLGSTSYIIQKTPVGFPYHQINHTLFNPAKNILSAQIQLARERLEKRFVGEIDAATSYMRASAYKSTETSEELKSKFALKTRNIVIYTHDFFDSPHVNRCLQFPDLFQYLKQTLQALTDIKDTSVFIKTHPNGIDGCKEIAIDLIKSFNVPHFYILDESVSNLNIIELKPDLIGTARGTIGVEMAYFGIPTVALFDNLYVNFNFVHSCATREEYFAVLKGEIKPDIDFNKENIYSFYYQAFMEKTPVKENNIFSIFASFKGELYSEDFLKHIKSANYINYRKSLIKLYADALEIS